MTMKPKMAPHDASRPFPLFKEGEREYEQWLPIGSELSEIN